MAKTAQFVNNRSVKNASKNGLAKIRVKLNMVVHSAHIANNHLKENKQLKNQNWITSCCSAISATTASPILTWQKTTF